MARLARIVRRDVCIRLGVAIRTAALDMGVVHRRHRRPLLRRNTVTRFTRIVRGNVRIRFAMAIRTTALDMGMINGRGLIPRHLGIRMASFAHVVRGNVVRGLGVAITAHLLHQQVVIHRSRRRPRLITLIMTRRAIITVDFHVRGWLGMAVHAIAQHLGVIHR